MTPRTISLGGCGNFSLVFIAAVIAAVAGVLAGFGGLELARQQANAERDMRIRLEKLVAEVTGGNSFVYLEPKHFKGEGVKYFIRQWGDYPSFDVVVRIQDADGHDIRQPYVVGTVIRHRGLDWTTIEGLGNPWPLTFPEPPPVGVGFKEFRIEIGARNGVFVQRIRVWPVANRWHTDSRSGDGPALLKLPPDFREAQEQDGA